MNKFEAQLFEDTGVIVGQIGGINVVAPEGDYANGKTYTLVYDSTDDVFNLTEYVDNVAGIPVEPPATTLTNAKVYNLVYNSTKEAFVLTEAT